MTSQRPEPVARVLLVEDDRSQAALASLAFARAGIANECEVAADGEEGLRLAKAGLEQGRPYDLLFVDLNMPRMDGRELLARLKQDPDLRRSPVVILTTSDNPDDVEECYTLGASSYIVKPFDLHELFAAIGHSLNFWCTVARLPRPDAGASA